MVEGTQSIAGKVDRLMIQSRRAIELWKKTDKPQLSAEGIKVDQAILETYTGQYEVNPQFTFTVSRQGDRLFLQATGQEKLEMFAGAADRFFLKVNDAQLQFVSEGGKITKAILKQGGRTTEAVKIK